MAEMTRFVEPSDNPVTVSLVGGMAWTGPTITYSFGYGDINKNGLDDFAEGDWKDFYREIVGNVQSFANVTFQEVAAPGNINFRLFEGGGGESGGPGVGVTTVDSLVGINPNVAGSASVVRLGTYSQTWFHETGHALGLKHTHDHEGGERPLPGVNTPGDWGTGNLNSHIYSVMGYTFPFLGEDDPFTPQVDFGKVLNAQPGSYGAIDIAALQHLYGARANATGDDTYLFSDNTDFDRGYTTIWDTGGTDTIEYDGQSRAKIDLRAATLTTEVGGGGWVSTSETFTGGFTIANGVTIENATGGANDDILIGNDVANVLFGGTGDDVITGGAGSDRIDGGAGRDRVVLEGGVGNFKAIYDADAAAAGLLKIRNIASGDVDTLTAVETLAFSDATLDAGRLLANLKTMFGETGETSSVLLSKASDDSPNAIHGAFNASATVRFDDVGGGSFQRVFDFGNGPDADNIWLGQVGSSHDMAFEILVGTVKHRVTAENAIVQGETADWTASVDDHGNMQLFKNGDLLAEGKGVVPSDIDRASELVGRSNWGWDSPLLGAVTDFIVSKPNAIPEIDGAFKMVAEVRFDDVDHGFFQRVFDTGNGADSDNIWLGQVGSSHDMAFEILQGSVKHRIVASNAIVQGETAEWGASVDSRGLMSLFKDGHLIAQGEGVVPLDIERTQDHVGSSSWSWDTPLNGTVHDLLFFA